MKRFVKLLAALGMATAAGLFVYRKFCRGDQGNGDITAGETPVATTEETPAATTEEVPTATTGEMPAATIAEMRMRTAEEMLASADIPGWPAGDQVSEPTPVG